MAAAEQQLPAGLRALTDPLLALGAPSSGSPALGCGVSNIQVGSNLGLMTAWGIWDLTPQLPERGSSGARSVLMS